MFANELQCHNFKTIVEGIKTLKKWYDINVLPELQQAFIKYSNANYRNANRICSIDHFTKAYEIYVIIGKIFNYKNIFL